MRYYIIALLCLPLCSFAQDSLNVTRLAELSLATGPELCAITLHGNHLYAPE